MSFSLDYLIQMLYTVPVLLIAFPVHELSHALTAKMLGDPTAKNMGRLTLNPFKHLDVLGTICLILFRFGWAKPVPINPYNFKNPRAGMAITALSGPLSNLVLGFISIVFMDLLGMGSYTNGTLFTILSIVYKLLYYSAWINISLCIFNLIPLPPLDGEKILGFFLPESAQAFFDRYAMYFQVVLMLLLFTPIITTPLSYMVTNIFNNLDSFVQTIFGLFIR
jgi:Zn-dependent protease